MKYAEKYPNITPYMRSLWEDEGLLRSDKSEPCLLCKEPTHFIDIASEAPFCSEECMKQFYDELSEKEKEDLNATYKLSIIFENLTYDQMIELQENIMGFKGELSKKEKEDSKATYKMSTTFENLSYDQMTELQEIIMDFKFPDWAPSHFVKVEQMKESGKNE